MLGTIAKAIFGSANDRRVKGYQARVNAINALEPEVSKLSDEALKARTAEFRQQLAEGATRWLSMSEEQRAEVLQRFELWRALPQERRTELRQRYEEFRALSPDEQARIRSMQRRVRELTPEKRSELQQRWREMTPEQRQHGRPDVPRPPRPEK